MNLKEHLGSLINTTKLNGVLEMTTDSWQEWSTEDEGTIPYAIEPDTGIIDTVEKCGTRNINDIEYSGNFTIKFYTKKELDLLQAFFGVRAQKFDMRLLSKRPKLLEELQQYSYGGRT